jgi:signal transduction histidine kinase
MRNFFSNLTIATRQWLLLGIVWSLTLVGVATTLYQLGRVSAEVGDIVTNWLPSLKVASTMRHNVGNFRRYQLQMLLVKDSASFTSYKHNIDSASTALADLIEQYRPLETPLDGPAYHKFIGLWRAYENLHRTTFAPVAEKVFTGERATQDGVSIVNGESRRQLALVYDALGELVLVNEQGAQITSKRIEAGQSLTRTVLIVSILVMLLVSGWLTWTVVGSITQPALALAEAAVQVASGNHEIQIGHYGKNELGTLANAFRSMNTQLALNSQVQIAINDLSTALSGDKTMGELASSILSFFARKLDVQASALYTLHPDRQTLVITGSYAMHITPEERKHEVAIGSGIVGQAAFDKAPIFLSDIPADNIRLASRLGSASDVLPRYVVALPFLYQDTLVGVVELWKLREWTSEQQHFLSVMQEPIAVALQTARNKSAMLTQNLTLATANEEIQRQVEVQAEQAREIELANAQLQDSMLELAAAKEEVEKQVEVQAQQQHELERFNQEILEQQEAVQKSMMDLQQSNWELIEAKDELQRQSSIQDEQAREIEIANTALQEKNLEIEHAMAQIKQAQQQVVQSEKMAGLGQLTAGVAHEINNPVTFISGAIKPLRRNLGDVLEVLKEYDTLKPDASPEAVRTIVSRIAKLKSDMELDDVIDETQELLKSMDNGASRIAEIVKGLRNFSRLDEHDLKSVDLHEGIDSTLTILRSQYKDHIEVVKEYGSLPAVDCYAGQLNQVFMNILSNAIQAIEGTGTIRIKTSLSNKSGQDFAVVSIKDSGNGMPEDVRKRIFEPFFTTKDVGKGTGLGLSISFGVIEKHGGTIEVTSEVGKGTEFVITLPVKQQSSAA